jgi:hypothetical protein
VGTTLARARGGPAVKARMTASNVTVDSGAKIFANATDKGNGGRVAVISAGDTEMDGAIEAKAGPSGGNGGFVETSGRTLGLTGNIDVSASIGATGTILLDPGTLDIVHSGTNDGSLDGSFSSGGGTLASSVGGTTGTVTDFEIQSLGSTGNIVLQATTLLDVQASLNVKNGLTMQSGGDLIVGPGLSIQAGTTLLLGSGIVFPAGTVGAAGAISLGAGDTLIAPTMILQGGSTGIALNNALLSASSTLDISAAGGGVTELNTGTISTPFLTSSSGIVGTASLMAPANSITALGGITVAKGNFDLDDAAPLAVNGKVAAGTGNILVQEGTGSVLTLNEGLFAAPAGTISVVADSLTVGDGGAIAAVGFGPVTLVERAPASNTVPVSLGVGGGLLLDPGQLAAINSGTLRIGAFTERGGKIDVTAPSITINGDVPIDLRAIAATLDLEANGSIREFNIASVSVGTLVGSTNGAPKSNFLMQGVGNDIDALGNVSVAGGDFELVDAAALTIVGAVSTGTPAAPSPLNTASISITASGTLTIGATALPGSLNAGTVALNAGNTISEPNGSIGANTLTAQSTLGSVLLSGGLDQIDTIAGLSAAGSVEIVADPTVLTLTGTATGTTLFFKNPAAGGTIALDAATLTATGTLPAVSLVADHLTQPATSTIVATGTGIVELAPASTTADVTVGGTADTLGAVLSAITPAAGALLIGGYIGMDGHATITAHSISIAAPLNLGTVTTELVLLSNGSVTQGAGDSLLNLGILDGSAEHFALLDGGNQIGEIANLKASGTAGIGVADTNALTVVGTVSAPAGQIFLQSSNAVTLGTDGTLAGGTLDSIEANGFIIDAGGTVLAGPVFELAPPSGTLTLAGLGGIGPDVLRFGAVTLPGSLTPTTTAGSIVVAGTLGSSGISLELDSLGGISETAPLTAGRLSGTSGGAALLTAGNTIGTLGSFAADGFTLNDTIPLTVTGSVTGGPGAKITDTGLLTVAGTGGVTANAVTLNAGSIEIDGLVSDGGAGTTSLVAIGGTISEAGTLISGTLSGSASLSASLTGTNTVATLTAFTAQGFTLDDSVPLTVTGAVAGGPSVLISDPAQLLTVAGTGGVAANAVALNAGSIAIDGLVSDGGAGTTSLIATGGTISEPGTLISGTLSGSASLSAVLTGTNTVGTLAAFTAQGFTLSDLAPLTIAGPVAGGPDAIIADAAPLTVADTGSVTADLVSLTGTDLTITGLVSDGGAGTTTLVATGETDDFVILGTIDETGTLISGTLSGSATGGASLLGATPGTNQITNLGPFSADAFAVDDGIRLTIVAAVTGGPSATINDLNQITVASSGSITANAISLTGTDLTIAGLVSDGGAGTTTLVATGETDDFVIPGTIGETGTLISGVLSGSATGGASLLGTTPTTNQIADIGPFSANGLTVDDGIGLTVGAAVAGGPSVTILDAGPLTVAAAGSVTANAISLTGTSIAIAGFVSDGGAGITSLIATSGAISESGTLISGTLSGSATSTASLLGTTPTTNQIADLGPFSANGLTIDDGPPLTVTSAVNGGPGAAINDAGALTVASAGSVVAQAISLTASGIGIAGLVSDGGAGTTALRATAGMIDETGTLISGALSGSATGTASLLGATRTTNQIANRSVLGERVDPGRRRQFDSRCDSEWRTERHYLGCRTAQCDRRRSCDGKRSKPDWNEPGDCWFDFGRRGRDDRSSRHRRGDQRDWDADLGPAERQCDRCSEPAWNDPDDESDRRSWHSPER